jgi:AcrR family transcriptional regulator
MSSSRAKLIASAKELFWRQGVAETSPRQVMRSSGVGQGSFYHHFPTKNDLALAAVQEAVAESLEAAQGELTSGAPAVERLRSYLGRPRDAVAGCRVGRLTYDQSVIDDPVLREPVREYFTTLLRLTEDVFAEMPGVNTADARKRAVAAVAVLQGGYVLSRALGDPDALSDAVAGFVDIVTEATP